MPGSGNVLIDAIAGIGWLSRGGDRNITFFFDNSFGFHNWTSGEKDAFQAALQQYANVANITIQQVGSSAAADLSERWVSDAYMRSIFGDFAGFHEFPKSSPPAGGAYNFDGRSYYTTSGLAAGGLGFEVFLHEIGHGLGLAHPHDTAMGTGLLPGVTSESSLGTLGYNQGLYTVMSYNDGPALSSGSNNYGHAATPMAFDIAAMQFLYGANNGYRTGADIYVIPDSNAAGASWQCIWDAGGTDEIAYYYGSRDVTIDLRAATIVNGDPNAGGFTSGATGIFGGFTTAKGVVIENVWGGNGNDARQRRQQPACRQRGERHILFHRRHGHRRRRSRRRQGHLFGQSVRLHGARSGNQHLGARVDRNERIDVGGASPVCRRHDQS